VSQSRIVLVLTMMAALVAATVIGIQQLHPDPSGPDAPIAGSDPSVGTHAAAGAHTSSVKEAHLSPGSELAPITGARRGLVDLLTPPTMMPVPATPEKGIRVQEPPARTSSRRGGLVVGYPRRELPVMPRSRVVTSSVSPADRALQVGLVGETRSSVESVASFYRARLVELGFLEEQVAAVGGSTGLGFRHGEDTVVVTITSHGSKRRAYVLAGTLHPEPG
jgi:hypothetical protein